MEKKPHWTLFLLLSFLPSPEMLISTATLRYKIVALKMHETTSHPEWWIRFVFPHHPPSNKNMTKPIFFALGILTPFPCSHHHSGQRIIHVSLASKRYWGDHSVRVEAIPSVWVFIMLSGQHSCSRDHMSYSQELIVQEVLNFKNKTDHLLKSCLPCGFPYFS